MFAIIGIIGFSNRKNDSHKQKELIFFSIFINFVTLKITPDIRLLQVYYGTREKKIKKLYITENFYKHFIQFEDK